MDCELSIIGSLLEINGDCPANLSRLLRCAPESFDDRRAGMVAKVIHELRQAGTPVHPHSINGKLSFPDSVNFLTLAANAALPVGLAEIEAEKIWREFQTRQTAKLFFEAAEQITKMPEHAADIRQRVVGEIGRLDAEHGDGLSIRTPDELLAMEFDDEDCILGDRLLAHGQSIVIAGQGGLGKSRLLLQFIVACRAGIPFIGFETRGHDLTWLVLQAENSNRRLQKDLAALRAWIGEKLWSQVSAGLFIHTLETDADNFLSLDNEHTQAGIRALIEKVKPDGIAWDSLYNFGVGNLNSDEDMTATLLSIARLSKCGNPQRAIVTLHHALTGKSGMAKAQGFERGGFARNSKVLHQWTRGQINVAPGLPDSNDVLVLTCGKCSNGKEFLPFAVRLDPETMIYAPDETFDLSAWQKEVTGQKGNEPKMTPERVRGLCHASMPKADLAKAIITDCGCARQVAYKHIQHAEEKGMIEWNPRAKYFNPK
jgi:hypothetical protein